MSRLPGVLITTRRNAALVAVTFGLLMLAASLTFDWLLLRHQGTTYLTVAVSDAFVGLLAGVLAWTLLGYELKERDRMEKRIEVLNEVNHHIRNALQTVAMALPRLEQHSEDPRFVTSALRKINETALLDIMSPAIRKWNGADLEAKLEEALAASSCPDRYRTRSATARRPAPGEPASPDRHLVM